MAHHSEIIADGPIIARLTGKFSRAVILRSIAGWETI
jgi:hypothetical protein